MILWKNELCRQKFSCVKRVKLSIITEIIRSSRWYSYLIISKVLPKKSGSGGIGICYCDPECIFTHSCQKFIVFHCSVLFLYWQNTHLVNILSTKHYLELVLVRKSGSGLSKIWCCKSFRSNLRHKVFFIDDDFEHSDNWDCITS